MLRPLVAALTLFVSAPPLLAQATGILRGTITDGDGKPVAAAAVTIERLDGVKREFKIESNSRGEFVQIGIPPGNYRVMAAKDGLGSQSFDARVRLGEATEVNFQLRSGEAAPPADEDAERRAAMRALFQEGVTASRAGQFDEAVAKFEEALELAPDCFDCHYNIGYARGEQKRYDEAEAAYRKALAAKPDFAQAYVGLAAVYNAQRRFEDAKAAAAEAARLSAAAGGATASATYNGAIVLWNAGDIAGAKKQLQDVLAIDPNHADAHYWLGMAHLNEGQMPEAVSFFNRYLELAPSGQYAAEAKKTLELLPK